MSAPPKKRQVDLEGNSSESDNYSSENEEGEEYTGQEEIQVEFEGRSPIDSDYHGIKQLLQQLFLKAHINLGELTDLIIGQSFVGSVVKQSETDENDEDDDDPNDVFGITSIINLTDKQNAECVSELRTLLCELSSEHGTERCRTLVQNLLSDDNRPLGLIINERFVNIPAQIAVPLLESLRKEIKKACEKKQPFNFSYYALICKLFKVDRTSGGSKKGKDKVGHEEQLIWSNPEEEIIDQEADCRLEFCVKDESDSGLGGSWLEEDVIMMPYRRVLFISADKLDHIIARIKESVV